MDNYLAIARILRYNKDKAGEYVREKSNDSSITG